MDDLHKDSEDYFCRFTFGQFVALILFEIVTLFFVFYLGAKFGGDLMGRGPKVVSSSEGVLPKNSPKNIDDIVGKKSVDYTYPDVLTGPKQGSAIKVKPSGMTADEFEKRGREDTKPDVQAEEKPKEKPEERLEETAQETPPLMPIEKVKTPVEAPKPPNSAKPGSKFTIQVGSYQSETEAQTAVNRWKGRGYQSYLTIGEVPNKGTWYRVRIGGFPTRDEAEEFLDRFQTREKTNALVVLSKN